VNLWGKVEFEITFKSMSQKKKKKRQKSHFGQQRQNEHGSKRGGEQSGRITRLGSEQAGKFVGGL
jgi:hypothetical protein